MRIRVSGYSRRPIYFEGELFLPTALKQSCDTAVDPNKCHLVMRSVISKASVQHVAVGHIAREWTEIQAPGLDLTWSMN